jgi:hypothetical protein
MIFIFIFDVLELAFEMFGGLFFLSFDPLYFWGP